MATITPRTTKSGEVRYRVTVRLKKDGQIVHQEVKTFGNKAVAKEWGRRREAELEKPGGIEKAQHKGVLLKKVIDGLQEETGGKFGRSRAGVISLLKRCAIAEKEIVSLTSSDFIEHCQERARGGTGGSTIGQDIYYLRAAIKYAKARMKLPVTTDAIDEAAEWLRDNRIIHKNGRRRRRPTYDELLMLDRYFASMWERGRQTIPMRLVMWFAIYSCRRQNEICNLMRSDINREEKHYTVRNLKNPNGSAGNDRQALMPDLGWLVLDDMKAAIDSRIDEDQGDDFDKDRLISINAKSVSAAFTRACLVLKIDDLCFHDLRHEGASRLAEDGFTIPQIQQVTLHDSWGSLSLYVNMQASKMKRLDYAAASLTACQS